MINLIEYLISVATIGVIFSISALGLNLRYGWTGDLDLARSLLPNAEAALAWMRDGSRSTP